MKDLNKRLVEVEYILKKMDNEYIRKIPQKIWDYIEENKDNNYVFSYDENKSLVEQKLNGDTISILTYINTEYLLDEKQKKEMINYLRKDEAIAEQEKAKKYNPNDLFKNIKDNKKQENHLYELKRDRWYQKIFNFFKNF